MKKRQKQQLMQKKPAELHKLISQKREEIMNVRLKGGEEKNTNKVKILRKELAILLTALREQEIVLEERLGGAES